MVLIHGIFSRKEHWVDFARRLTDDYQVIVIDLPGFGDNGLLPDSEYALQKQSENLSAVFDALELSDVHVGANSMGASIIAQIAVEQPDRIASLAFIGSPLGVTSPTLSDMERAIAEGKTPLLVRSQEEFEGRNSWLSPNGISVPQPILTTWMHAELAQVEKNARIWAVVHDENPVPDLLELAPKLNMPTQILWCTEDRIFHVNGAAVLARKLSSAKLDVLDNCGHVPMVDAPEETAMRYLNFLTSLRTSIKPTD
ncbi:alpha/beta fold hydrolase [Parasphingorhabdus litoris]|uniref:Alpha/beta fold hydrolase n=1 Tax=Parasphingorhabdus litoris TaxID=394733 RepID=A0ABP3JVL5_9SPHN